MSSRPILFRIKKKLLPVIAIFVLLIFPPFKTANDTQTLFSRLRTEAKIAFFIQVSSETVTHVPRLLKSLHHPKNIYAIHLDIKISSHQASRIKSMLRRHDNYSNVIIIPSEPISYGGISMLLNTLNALEILLQVSPDWDFFINLSGADYPLVSPNALRKLLGTPAVRMGRLNMIQGLSDHGKERVFKRRLAKVFVDQALYPAVSSGASKILDMRTDHPLSKKPQNETSFLKSEGWVVLHRSFSQYAVNSAPGRRLLLSYATTWAPDELFFGTLLNSSEFRTTIARDAMRHIVWPDGGGPRPIFLDERDVDIRKDLVSSGAILARKFAHPESALLDFIDAKVNGISFDRDENAVNKFYQRAKARIVCAAEKHSLEACASG